MKRVLHILAGMDVGGIETWLVHVLRQVATQRVELHFLVHSKRKCFYDDEIESLGGKLIHNKSPRNIVSYCIQLYKLLKSDHKYDVIHCHLHYFSGVVMCVGYLAGVPVRIAHSHNDKRSIESKSSILRKFYVYSMRFLIQKFTTAGLACSEQAAEDLFGQSWKIDQRFTVCFCALNVERFVRSITSPRRTRNQGLSKD